MRSIAGVALVFCVTAAFAQGVPSAAQKRHHPTGEWQQVNGTAVPATALSAGPADQFVCRGAVQAVIIAGHATAGTSGCHVAFQGRELTLNPYEVLVSSSAPVRAGAIGGQVAAPGIARGGEVSGAGGGGRADAPATLNGTLIPVRRPPGTCLPGIDMRDPLAGAQSIQNRFGPRPYIEATFADGSVRRLSPGGNLTVQLPGQAPETCAPGFQRLETPAPTMPDLPADSSQTRLWLDHQNESLLNVLHALVTNSADLQAFSAEEQTSAGTNVYSQIVFRTSIINFYASKRK
jgi:hypothetical protein